MKSEDVMQGLRKDIWVSAVLVRILNAPSFRGVSTSDMHIGTPFGPIIEHIMQNTAPSTRDEIQVSPNHVVVDEIVHSPSWEREGRLASIPELEE